MISKRLFLKSIREELRHKVWMIALSMLGNFLAMPVVWLLRYTDVDMVRTSDIINNTIASELEKVIMEAGNMMVEYFQQSLLAAAGIIAILGAVIVGLESFRFLQQKSMVDTYHSLPVSRSVLFGAKYVSGLLIWLVPYLLCMALTWIFASVLMIRVGGAGVVPRLFLAAGKNTAILLIVFMLVYHLMLLATMLTGNVLNTLVVSGVLGGGVLTLYGLLYGFNYSYFHTYIERSYYDGERGLQAALCCSPIVSPIYLLAATVDKEVAGENYPAVLLACLGMALLLGVLAWLAYSRRPSERGGHGVDLKWIAAPLRIFVSIVGGMGGWLFMYYLMGGTAWCIFGALLVGILAYGVLDVVFSMDFKAFFRHRWSMAAAAVVTLLVCFGFLRDWTGYDRYLPQQEQIRQVSVYCRSYTNNPRLYSLPEAMELTDTAQIYAFLERGVDNTQGRLHKTAETELEELYCGESHSADTFYVRVVLENGRSYYRKYNYYEWDEDVVLPLLCSEEYAHNCYFIPEEILDNCYNMTFTNTANETGEAVTQKEILRQVAEAYNQDLLEQPRTVILNQGRAIGRVQMWVEYKGRNTRWYLDVNENMSHTLQAMEQNQIQFQGQSLGAEDVESLSFLVKGASYWYTGDTGISLAERSIRGHFGVYPEHAPALEGQPACETEGSEPQGYELTITDPAEIGELLPLIQFTSMHKGDGELVQALVGGVSILDRQGTEWNAYIRRGTLPEKYIQRLLGTQAVIHSDGKS